MLWISAQGSFECSCFYDKHLFCLTGVEGKLSCTVACFGLNYMVLSCPDLDKVYFSPERCYVCFMKCNVLNSFY